MGQNVDKKSIASEAKVLGWLIMEVISLLKIDETTAYKYFLRFMINHLISQ